ncbi:uncharacterized protein I206_107691 [Kwoniella pini CBS 10737]|uniref:RFX-type winged-helix domain-containing protein n=1 Tax=Kwoniella pini CBS 10737 TaxID=1296096 RepID=A0A1B9HY08_9TREE|nr:uncharacterized protein I206_06025 [Kwoniella pini CBS 10737]OCF48157.1 hypothetical protein I206_06025 [Kwoniella pini CBS 10737]
MADSIDFGFTYPSNLSSSPKNHGSSSDVLLQHHGLGLTDFQLDSFNLSNSPEHPQGQDGRPNAWAPVDIFNGGFNAMNLDTSPVDISNSFEAFNTVTPSFTPIMDYTPLQSFQTTPHMLSHASSCSSLASISSSISQQHDDGRLLVQTFPTEMSTSDYIPIEHSGVPTSTIPSIPPFDEKLFTNQPLPMMDMSMHSLHQSNDQSLMFGNNQGIQPTELFQQQPPRLAIRTQNLPDMGSMNTGLGKMNRERSSSRSTPYNRYRSDSVSVKSEADDEIATMLSASTTYSNAPWSAIATFPANGGIGKNTLHHRRTSSNMSFNTPTNASPIRPMLSRNRRSTSFILAKQSSHSDFQTQLQSIGITLSGSALERQETVRKDLIEKSVEIRRIASQIQQDKARNLWVRRWLMLSYCQAPGRTVPRQGLYHSYTVSCDEYGLKPINSASFGKAVRAAFPGIKTRRLGVRGNSKYHYVSIQPAIKIEAERLNGYGDSSGAWHVIPEDGSMDFRAESQEIDEDMDEEDLEDSEEEDDPFSTSTIKRSPSSYDLRQFTRATSGNRSRATSINDSFSIRPRFPRRHTTAALSGSLIPQRVPKMSSPTPVYNLPGFPTIADAGHLAGDQSLQDFWNSFCHHQEILMDSMRCTQLDQYELNCRTFWAGLSHRSYQITSQSKVSSMISDAMAVTYDNMIGILLSKLGNNLNMTSQNALRALAESLEIVMEESLAPFSAEFKEAKIELAVRSAHLFARFLDLRQITFALEPILSDPTQTRGMIAAWNGLDIRSVSDQCALSCSCEQDVLEQVLADFGQWLTESQMPQNRNKGVERLSGWIDRVLIQVLAIPGITMRAIVCRVGFITSQIMRDFTLKSEKSFGLFQLLKTFIDDYVSITSLRQTALSSQSVEPRLENLSTDFTPQHSNRSSLSSMNVFIPSPNGLTSSTSSLNDLSTAGPSFMADITNDNFNSGQAQYLSIPMEGIENGDNMITPRPFEKNDYSENIESNLNLTPYSS